MGEDGNERRDASGASGKQVYDLHVTLDPTTGEFEVNANFPGVVLQLGMLEYALVMLKRADASHQARNAPRVVPVMVLPPVKH